MFKYSSIYTFSNSNDLQFAHFWSKMDHYYRVKHYFSSHMTERKLQENTL